MDPGAAPEFAKVSQCETLPSGLTSNDICEAYEAGGVIVAQMTVGFETTQELLSGFSFSAQGRANAAHSPGISRGDTVTLTETDRNDSNMQKNLVYIYWIYVYVNDNM
jgi:hypothetical protein